MLHRLGRPDPEAVGPRADHTVRVGKLETYLERRAAWERARPRRHGAVDVAGGKPALLVTFDDGYRNAHEQGLPVLERHGATAIYFVTTGFVTGEAYPMELELSDALEGRTSVDLPGGDRVRLKERSGRKAVYERIRRKLKPLCPTDRETYLEEMARHNGYDRRDVQTEQFSSPEEVRRLDEHDLVTVGAHAHLHPVLTEISWRETLRELRTCRERLEGMLARPVRHLAYPYGAHDFAVRRIARLAGFACAFTTGPGRCRRIGWWNRLRVPRTDISALAAG